MLLAAACAPPAIVKKVAPTFKTDRYVVLTHDLTAIVRVSVSPQGNVTADSIATTTGLPILDAEALTVVKQWEFTPSTSACSANDFTVNVAFAKVPLESSSYIDPCLHDASVAHMVMPYPTEPPYATDRLIAEVLVSIDSQGLPYAARITESSGSPALDNAAIDAAKKTTYTPKVVDCKPVPGTYTFKVTFQTNN